MADPQDAGRQCVAIAPLFMVRDVVASAAYYGDVLGFAHEGLWGEPPSFCMPMRDEMTIMLKQADDPGRIRPNGAGGCEWDAYVWVRDADALFAEVSAKGARIVYGLVDQAEYGNREFAVADLDGYVIAFGHNIAAKARRAAGAS